MPNQLVIDLSHWNTIPQSLVAARDSGVRGVIHKATEGTGTVDNKLGARFNMARDAGMLWGMYHFIRPGRIADQADFFVRTAVPLIDQHTLLALDYEDADVSLGQCEQWISKVEVLTGHSVVLYSGHVLKDKIKAGDIPGALVERRLWLAQYTTGKPTLPKGWSKYWLWQWSDKGTVPGIEPPTDVNDFQDGIDALEEQWSGAFSPPQPVPPEPVQRPTITITTTGDVAVVVNGVTVT